MKNVWPAKFGFCLIFLYFVLKVMEAVYEMVLPGNNCHSEIMEQVGQDGQTKTESLSLSLFTSAGRLSVSEDGPGP